jgi:uncharacterized protein with FMN-binding domain
MLPRRAVAAIATTAVALALLLNFKTPTTFTGPTSVVVGQPSTGGTVDAGTQGTSGSGAASGTGSSPAPAAASTAPTAAGAGGSTGSGASTGSAGSGSSSTGQAASAGTLKSGRFTGSVVQIPFGNVQVQVTVQGGRITDAQMVQMPTAHARSQMISQYVAPILRQEVLQAQSAQINLVSGATYTSEAYAQSLQAAIDQAVA